MCKSSLNLKLASELFDMHIQLYRKPKIMWRRLKKFLLVEGIQQTEIDFVMSYDATTGNHPMIQQTVTTITCYKCGWKSLCRKDCPSLTCTIPVPDQNPTCSPPTTVKQTVTASYAVLQSTLVTILKEIWIVKQNNQQLRKSIQQLSPKQTPPLLNSQ